MSFSDEPRTGTTYEDGYIDGLSDGQSALTERVALELSRIAALRRQNRESLAIVVGLMAKHPDLAVALMSLSKQLKRASYGAVDEVP